MKSIKNLFFVLISTILFTATPLFAADATGVWLATVSINRVIEVSNSEAVVTLPRTSAEFPLRILLHVDASGTMRLLKEALLMEEKNSPNNKVVLADSGLASGYNGVSLRDGVMVGLRTSAIGYDFKGSTRNCTGVLKINGTAECSFTLLPDDPTNPFLHRFHPDHDNLDESFSKSSEEAYKIDRTFKLTFSDRYPANPDEPKRPDASKPLNWGVSEFGGTFSETITGLHKKTLSVSGWFTIRQLAKIANLKP